jgi:16S rRNA (adenine1518-N6/adenine1519-N6)-dimethyltransferase
MPHAPLAQHFLADPRAAARIVGAAALAPGEVALDMGAGEGALTRRLADAVRPGGRVVAVELDPAMAARLRRARWPGVEVVEEDALRARLPERLGAVVANPPFHLASPLLDRLLDHGFGRAVLVVPRELAERLTATPGSERYGRLTVRTALRAEVQRCFDLPRRAFRPPPDVPASVLRLVPRTLPRGLGMAWLDAVLDAAWASKRRTLRHGLAPLAARLRVSSGHITRVLEERGWSAARPGDLSPAQHADLARAIATQPPEARGGNPGGGRPRSAQKP